MRPSLHSLVQALAVTMMMAFLTSDFAHASDVGPVSPRGPGGAGW